MRRGNGTVSRFALFLVASLALVGVVRADPAFGPSWATKQGATTVQNTKILKFTSGCTLTNAGTEADVACAGAGGTVTSIAPADSTLTFTPNPIVATGTIGINLANSNIWTGNTTFAPASGVPVTVTGVASQNGYVYTGTAPASIAGTVPAGTSSILLTGAAGGATSGTTGQTAGTGEGISLTMGAGGTAPVGSTNGTGGSFLVIPGTAGAGLGTAGSKGAAVFRAPAATYGTVLQVQNSASATHFSVADTGLTTITDTSSPTSALFNVSNLAGTAKYMTVDVGGTVLEIFNTTANDVSTVLYLQHSLSSGGPATTNFGVSEDFLLDNSTGAQIDAGAIHVQWTTATAGATVSKMDFLTSTGGGSVNTTALSLAGNADATFSGNVSIASGKALKITNLLISSTAPTVSNCGTGATVSNNGTASFRITVGTGGTSTCEIALPSATTGWNCFCSDFTTITTTVYLCRQTVSSTTSATIGNYKTDATSANWIAGDVLYVSCFAN